MNYPGRRYLLLLPLALAAMLVAASMTGYLVSRSHSHKERLDMLVNSSTESLSWSPEAPGDLRYVKITGSIKGNGSVRVYLQSGDGSYLILDSGQLPGGLPLTGMLTGIEANQTEASNETEPGPGNETLPVPENETTEPPNLTAGNETGTAAGPQNASVNATEPAGGEAPPGVNESGLNETANVTIPEANATGQLNETLPPGNETGNVTGPEVNVTEPPERSFEDECIETCSLEGFTEDSYALVFEIEPGTVLIIDTIEYSVRVPVQENVTAPENLTDITNLTLPGNITVPLPENITKFPEVNLTIIDFAELNLSIQLMPEDLLDISDMLARGFGMHRCSSTQDCNEKISAMSSGGIITLEEPLDCGGDCLDFRNSKNIILDCMGNTITGNGTGTGISLENSTYVMIKNCDVSGFERGIVLDDDSDFNIITNTRASSNERDIAFSSSVSNIFNNINASITVSGKGG
jgi:parallel beta-helix repeat protein